MLSDPKAKRCRVCGLLCYEAIYYRDGEAERVMIEAAPRADGKAWLDIYGSGMLVVRRAGGAPDRARYASHSHSEAIEHKGMTWTVMRQSETHGES